MRITGGRYKGHCLRCPGIHGSRSRNRRSVVNIRPVMAKMREAIFSMLYSRLGGIEGLRFLDLFGGSGLMSVEAASRGFAYLEVVESDPHKKKVLEQNLSIVEVPWKLHICSVQAFLQKIQHFFQEERTFDVVYIDPPFAMENKEQILEALDCSGLCRDGGLVLLHRPKTEVKQTESAANTLSLVHFDSLVWERNTYYGGSALCCYRVESR